MAAFVTVSGLVLAVAIMQSASSSVGLVVRWCLLTITATGLVLFPDWRSSRDLHFAEPFAILAVTLGATAAWLEHARREKLGRAKSFAIGVVWAAVALVLAVLMGFAWHLVTGIGE